MGWEVFVRLNALLAALHALIAALHALTAVVKKILAPVAAGRQCARPLVG
jgi:hypothetical protein